MCRFVKKRSITKWVMIVAMLGLCTGIMILYPAKVNYLMYFVIIVFVALYEDTIANIFSCGLTFVLMYVFFLKYKEDLSVPWEIDSTVIMMIYVLIIFFTIWYQSYLSKKAAAALAKSNAEKDVANEQTKELLDKIQMTADSLVVATQEMNKNIKNASEISDSIDVSSDKASSQSQSEFESIRKLRDLFGEGVEQVSSVKEASSCVSQSSLSTQNVVETSKDMAVSLSSEMGKVLVTMNDIFDNVSRNTKEVLLQSREVDENSEKLSIMFETTFTEFNEISSNVESTTALLQEIAGNVNSLNKNISNIVEEQNEISTLTEKLAN